MDIMDFNKLYAIYGNKLPSQAVFFSDGKHSITPKNVAKHYGARKMHTIWDKFVADYKAKATKPVVKPVPKKPAGKPAPTKGA